MSRLNIERQKELEPERMQYAKNKLNELMFEITSEINIDNKKYLEFVYKGEVVRFYPYSGWATGKSIKDGRGLQNLLNQLKQ